MGHFLKIFNAFERVDVVSDIQVVFEKFKKVLSNFSHLVKVLKLGLGYF